MERRGQTHTHRERERERERYEGRQDTISSMIGMQAANFGARSEHRPRRSFGDGRLAVRDATAYLLLLSVVCTIPNYGQCTANESSLVVNYTIRCAAPAVFAAAHPDYIIASIPPLAV